MTIPSTMPAVGFSDFGGPEVLGMVELPVPHPAADQVLIRVTATPVNPADVLFRAGGVSHLLRDPAPPHVPGLELAGVVAVVGSHAGDVAVGDRVIAITTFIPTGRGAQSAYVAVPAAAVVAVPAGCDDVAASTLPMNGLTARLALDRAGLPADGGDGGTGDGATVVVTGAAGAVGGYVVQLARAQGVRVIALAGPPDHDAVRAMGADEVAAIIDGDVAAAVRGVWDGPVDAVVDAALLGAPCAAVLPDGGRIIALRPTDYGPAPGIDVQQISVREYGTDQARLRRLADLTAQGALTLRVAATFTPDQAAQAHRRMDAGGLRGRPVLVW